MQLVIGKGRREEKEGRKNGLREEKQQLRCEESGLARSKERCLDLALRVRQVERQPLPGFWQPR